MVTNEELLQKIETFIIKHKISASKFGRLAKNDSLLVFRLRKGQDIRQSGKLKILDFMKNYKRLVK